MKRVIDYFLCVIFIQWEKVAVEAVASFLKDKMPGAIGTQVESFIKGEGAGNIGDWAGGLKDALGGFFNK